MKNIWHTPPQTPDVFKSHPIIVIYEAGDEIEQMDSTEYNDLVGERYVNRWCYVDDLLALETELTKTKQALDVVVDVLKEIDELLSSNKFDVRELPLLNITQMKIRKILYYIKLKI